MIPRSKLLLLLALGVAGVSCRSTSPQAPGLAPARSPAPARRRASVAAPQAPVALALLGYATDKGICLARVTEAGLQASSCVPTPAPVEELLSLRGEELVALLDSGAVAHAHGGVLTMLPLPPERSWDRPEPTIAGLAVGPGTRRKLVVTREGEVWLGRCAWVGLQDAPTCVSWAFARLAPSPATSDEEPKAWTPSWSDDSKPPPGVDLRIENAPESGAPARIFCTKDGATSLFTVPGEPGASTSVSFEWVGAPSTAYLLSVTYDHLEAFHGEVVLKKACDPTFSENVTDFNIQEEAVLVHGPGGLWINLDEHRNWNLRLGERVLDLPDAASNLVFVPLP